MREIAINLLVSGSMFWAWMHTGSLFDLWFSGFAAGVAMVIALLRVRTR